MIEISTELLKQTVYKLCYNANICLNNSIYYKILYAYNNENNSQIKNHLKFILQNAKIAYEAKMPLCQDTGQVIVFMEVGQNIVFIGDFIEDAINQAVEQCYKDNFFRKSVVNNAVFDRSNTKTNTPCIIYTKYTKNDFVKISVIIKGAGSENKSKLSMLLPTSNENEIIKQISDLILDAGINACPPMFIGIGIGETSEKAIFNSKLALISDVFTQKETDFADKIKFNVNKNAPYSFGNAYVLDIKLITSSTHIACLPVGITINCHSDRFSSAVIKNNQIFFNHKIPDFKDFQTNELQYNEILTCDIEKLKSLKPDDNILLTGELFVARDMAHKKIIDLIHENKPLPFQLKDKIIFYAGPCPNPPDKITGSIGPTTAQRMDKYALELYKQGIFATIGKGSRSSYLVEFLKNNNKRYFSTQGGIASLLAQKIKKSEVIAFHDLGPESVFKIYVEKFPVKVEI